MLQLPEIIEMWKKDAVIDQMNLDEASLNSAKLHAKYLELINTYKLKLKQSDYKFKVLLKKKFLWYNGKMSKVEMDELGWSYDPLNGLKILKGEMNYYYDADEHIHAAQGQIDYLTAIIDTLKEIMDSIKWRSQSIKNAIEWRKFTSGA